MSPSSEAETLSLSFRSSIATAAAAAAVACATSSPLCSSPSSIVGGGGGGDSPLLSTAAVLSASGDGGRSSADGGGGIDPTDDVRGLTPISDVEGGMGGSPIGGGGSFSFSSTGAETGCGCRGCLLPPPGSAAMAAAANAAGSSASDFIPGASPTDLSFSSTTDGTEGGENPASVLLSLDARPSMLPLEALPDATDPTSIPCSAHSRYKSASVKWRMSPQLCFDYGIW